MQDGPEHGARCQNNGASKFLPPPSVAGPPFPLAPSFATSDTSAHPILGNGFGSTVTYQSKDPRTLAAFPDGRYTAMSFEWGYLDHALDMGILGVAALVAFLAVLMFTGLRRGGDAAALALGLGALAIVHITSPYLNHPLGLGIMLWLFAYTAPHTSVEA